MKTQSVQASVVSGAIISLFVPLHDSTLLEDYLLSTFPLIQQMAKSATQSMLINTLPPR